MNTNTEWTMEEAAEIFSAAKELAEDAILRDIKGAWQASTYAGVGRSMATGDLQTRALLPLAKPGENEDSLLRRAIAVQALYTVGNMGYMRGPKAKMVKEGLRKLARTGI